MNAVLNRHGEPICDWSDLPTTGCAHCTGAKLDVLADRLDRCARICWRQQHQGDEGDNPCS